MQPNATHKRARLAEGRGYHSRHAQGFNVNQQSAIDAILRAFESAAGAGKKP